MLVAVGVNVTVAVGDAVGVGVGDGVAVGVSVTAGVRVTVGVRVGVLVAVGVNVTDAVGDAVGARRRCRSSRGMRAGRRHDDRLPPETDQRLARVLVVLNPEGVTAAQSQINGIGRRSTCIMPLINRAVGRLHRAARHHLTAGTGDRGPA